MNLETTKKPEKKNQPKMKIEAIDPTAIVDVWRLVKESLVSSNQTYPDLTEESPELIQSHLFNYMQQRGFTGLIARLGKKPIGVVLGNIASRAYGRPKRYAFVWCMWITPSARKTGAGKLLWTDYTERLKKAEIYHWESFSSDELAKSLVRETGFPIQKLNSLIGGRT